MTDIEKFVNSFYFDRLYIRGVRKAANNIKHYKTTADSVPEWLTLYGDDEGPNTEKRS